MKIPECDHDFEECEISNPYNYDFDEFKPCDSNQRFHPYYCKKCGMLDNYKHIRICVSN